MNNAVYGKTMEHVRNHIDFELVSTQERMNRCINNPNYKGCHIINEELAGAEKIKTQLKLDKPIYLGMSILDRFICILSTMMFSKQGIRMM